jgi:hypothetical protein
MPNKWTIKSDCVRTPPNWECPDIVAENKIATEPIVKPNLLAFPLRLCAINITAKPVKAVK